MKSILIVSLMVSFSHAAVSQSVFQKPFVFMGVDDLPSGYILDKTFYAYNQTNGGASFGQKTLINWKGDDIGKASLAAGINVTASGVASTAFGHTSKTRGKSSLAAGLYNTASGDIGAMALGVNSFATGDWGAIAIGKGCRAMGNDGSSAMGNESESRGNTGAMALGNYTVANGNLGAIAMGNYTIANGNSSTVVGMFNEELVDSAQVVNESSPIFVVGNGWSIFNRSNALIAKKDGKMGVGRNPLSNLLEVEGSASKTTAGNWLANSDRRIKKDISNIHDSYEKILQLRPVKFHYTNEWRTKHPEIQDHYYYNFIAQEYAEVFPDQVQGSGEYLKNDPNEIIQIDTYNSQILNLAATQELIKDVQKLKNENEYLKKQLSKIEGMMVRLALYETQVTSYSI